jgi:EmrB/QacA subfamily drug resistance transporter
MADIDTATRANPTRATETLRGANPKRWALVVIAVAQLMIVLDTSVIIVALPSAQRALGISTADRQWVLSAYTLVFGTLLLLGGRLADYLGRRRMLQIGLLGFAAASALGGLAQDPAMLFGARALQGAFAALMAPASLSLLTVTFTEARERARAFGVYSAVAGGGVAIGLVLGGTLTDLASWRWTLLINVPIALVAATAVRRVLPESRADSRGSYDLPGAALVTSGMFLLVYGFTTAGTDGWGSKVTIGLLAAAAAALVGFVATELRVANPLLPMRVILDRRRAGAYLASFFVGIAMLGTFLFLTYFLQATQHYSALKTGFAFLPLSGGIILGAAVASQLLPRLGPRTLMLTGLFLAAVGLSLFTRLGVSSTFVSGVLPAELVMSLGLALTFVPMSSTSLLGIDQRDAGVASALNNATQQVGGSLGIALLNTVAASAAASYLSAHARGLHGASAKVMAVATVHGYTRAFVVSAVMIVVAFVLTAVLLRSTGPEAVAELSPELGAEMAPQAA